VAKHFQKRAKRANKPNPREDRNFYQPGPYDREFRHDENPRHSRKKVQINPRNLAQEEYVDCLYDPSRYIVFAMGPAGCGKTLLATLYAIHGLQSGDYDKIIITRPAVSVDEQHGFLPGDLNAKMQPWVLPILDVFKEHYSVQQVERLILDEKIEVAPLAYMRGRTFKNAIILADEMQNATPSQMKMVLTRIGEGSRMVVTGDLRQHDRGFEQNGLKDFLLRLHTAHSQSIAVVEFGSTDIERHPVIEEVLALYGDE
jgi:phosphate starvation-inducible protein PhoH and related proteins